MPEETYYTKREQLLMKLNCEVCTLDMVIRAGADNCNDRAMVEALLGVHRRLEKVYRELDDLIG